MPPSGIRCSEHITPALIGFHWLRVPERISFKLAVLPYRAIRGTGLTYLQSCFTRMAGTALQRRLRSSCSDRLHIPLVRLSTVGSRIFPVSCAAVWNDLPAVNTTNTLKARLDKFCHNQDIVYDFRA